MQRIERSVGQGGDNGQRDVRVVQRLLNRQNLTPLAAVREDGRIDSGTIEAIRHFQVRFLNMKSPDGRVDPDGRTLQRLSHVNEERGSGENPETRRTDRAARDKIVDPRVRETALTTRILDALVPKLANIRAKVISGYLSDSDLFWKVNYHWEYLLDLLKHSLTLSIDEADAKDLENLRSSLLSCPPRPASGYTSGALGRPQDESSMDEVTRRHKLLSSCKQWFKKVVVRADLKSKSRKSGQAFDLACAPVAHPGSSKHSTGYALDIQGDNSAIRSVCNGAGATLVFDEKSHVHVEFKNGIGG